MSKFKKSIKKIFDGIEDIPVGVSIAIPVIGLIMGSVFTFGIGYWNAPIDREEATAINAIYDSYRISYGKYGSVSIVTISFSDHEDLEIDGACFYVWTEEALKELPQGSSVQILKHPNSDTILEMKHGDNTVLSFEEAIEDLNGELIGFVFLGIFIYFCAAIGLASLLTRGIVSRKSKKSINSNTK